jgi:hypothetical protein
MVLKFLACRVKRKFKYKFPLASLKRLFRKPHQICSGFSPVNIHSRLSEQFSGSQLVSGTTFKMTESRWNYSSEEGYWKDFHN